MAADWPKCLFYGAKEAEKNSESNGRLTFLRSRLDQKLWLKNRSKFPYTLKTPLKPNR